MPRTAWIGLGANLGDPPAQLRAALRALAAVAGVRLRGCSALYRSPPMGPQDQPAYANAVAEVETELTAEALMVALLEIERAAGRVRGPDRWGPRVLDLDLLHVEGEQRDLPGLTLPHPGIAERAFVLLPWAELAPALSVPGVGRIGECAQAIDARGLECLGPLDP